MCSAFFDGVSFLFGSLTRQWKCEEQILEATVQVFHYGGVRSVSWAICTRVWYTMTTKTIKHQRAIAVSSLYLSILYDFVYLKIIFLFSVFSFYCSSLTLTNTSPLIWVALLLIFFSLFPFVLGKYPNTLCCMPSPLDFAKSVSRFNSNSSRAHGLY